MSIALISQSRGSLCQLTLGRGRAPTKKFSGIFRPNLECGASIVIVRDPRALDPLEMTLIAQSQDPLPALSCSATLEGHILLT
jgi:hypothetical protein